MTREALVSRPALVGEIPLCEAPTVLGRGMSCPLSVRVADQLRKTRPPCCQRSAIGDRVRRWPTADSRQHLSQGAGHWQEIPVHARGEARWCSEVRGSPNDNLGTSDQAHDSRARTLRYGTCGDRTANPSTTWHTSPPQVRTVDSEIPSSHCEGPGIVSRGPRCFRGDGVSRWPSRRVRPGGRCPP